MKSLDIPWEKISQEFSKDMNLLGWNLPIEIFSGGRESLISIIEKLLKHNPKMVKELMYRMSINEITLSKSLKNNNLNENAIIIADHIISRSLERINLRNFY